MISVFSKVFLPLTKKKWKHLSLYPLGTSDWEIPMNSSHLCRSFWVILPVARVDPSLLWETGRKEGCAHTTEMSQQRGFILHHFGMIWKLYTPGICGRPEKHLMNVHRWSRSRHRPLPLASFCYHVPFRLCLTMENWKLHSCDSGALDIRV